MVGGVGVEVKGSMWHQVGQEQNETTMNCVVIYSINSKDSKRQPSFGLVGFYLVHRGVGQHLLQRPHRQGLLQNEAADGKIWRDILKIGTMVKTEGGEAMALLPLDAGRGVKRRVLSPVRWRWFRGSTGDSRILHTTGTA